MLALTQLRSNRQASKTNSQRRTHLVGAWCTRCLALHAAFLELIAHIGLGLRGGFDLGCGRQEFPEADSTSPQASYNDLNPSSGEPVVVGGARRIY